MQSSATSGSLCAIADSVTLINIDQEHNFRVSAEVIRGSAFSSCSDRIGQVFCDINVFPFTLSNEFWKGGLIFQQANELKIK